MKNVEIDIIARLSLMAVISSIFPTYLHLGIHIKACLYVLSDNQIRVAVLFAIAQMLQTTDSFPLAFTSVLRHRI